MGKVTKKLSTGQKNIHILTPLNPVRIAYLDDYTGLFSNIAFSGR